MKDFLRQYGEDHARDLAEEAAKDANEPTQELPTGTTNRMNEASGAAGAPYAQSGSAEFSQHAGMTRPPDGMQAEQGFGLTGEMHGEQSNTVPFNLPPGAAFLGSFMRPEPFAAEPMLQFFQYEHLPARLQMVSYPFCQLANSLVGTLPRNPERTVALRKLLEAKDCAVWALLYVSVDGTAQPPR